MLIIMNWYKYRAVMAIGSSDLLDSSGFEVFLEMDFSK